MTTEEYQKGWNDCALRTIKMIHNFRNKLKIHADEWPTFKLLGELQTELYDLIDKEQECNS